MKRLLLILLVVIIFLLLLGAILWKVFQPAKPATINTGVTFPTSTETQVPTGLKPDQFAAAFYTWYFVNYTNNYGNEAHLQAMHARLPEWLTPEFAANFKTILTDTDADPIFLAQDSPPLDSKITSSIVSQSTTASDVRITFTSSVGTVGYVIHLLKINSEWRIDSVVLSS
jgi:hypothetical protein